MYCYLEKVKVITGRIYSAYISISCIFLNWGKIPTVVHETRKVVMCIAIYLVLYPVSKPVEPHNL